MTSSPRLSLRLQRRLFCVLLLLTVAVSARATDLQGRVEWIYDGDTIGVEGVGKVRLLGIDTPEGEESGRDRFFVRLGADGKSLRRIAAEALQFNIALAKGKEVRLTLDHEILDGYRRLLAYVVLPDGRLLNRLLLEKGFAVVYRRFDFRMKEEFLADEAAARRQRVGLWKLNEKLVGIRR